MKKELKKKYTEHLSILPLKPKELEFVLTLLDEAFLKGEKEVLEKVQKIYLKTIKI